MDITKGAGIDFVHTNGAHGEKLLPETMGSGVAFLDFDGDGDADLFLVNSEPWPGGKASGTVGNRLYRNDGRGHFKDTTAAAGLDRSLYGMGVAVGDYDNDGDPDLYVTALGGGVLYRNDRGKFADVTAEANAEGGGGWLTSAAFFDLENDGDLDLFLCRYVDWSPEKDRAEDFKLRGDGRAYGPPTAFGGRSTHSCATTVAGSSTSANPQASASGRPSGGCPSGNRWAWRPTMSTGTAWSTWPSPTTRCRTSSSTTSAAAGSRRSAWPRGSPSIPSARRGGRWGSTGRTSATTRPSAWPSATSPTR
jgi:hypothetical protein